MRLRLRDSELVLEPGRPLLMGIVNAGPDSFSDPGRHEPDELVERGLELVQAGAALIDVGAESGRTDRRPVSEDEEAARMAPVVKGLADAGVAVSADTWRAGPARAALEAGAAMLNDASALADPKLAEAASATGAALVLTHTRTAPKTKAFRAYDDVVADVTGLLGELAERARGLGVAGDQLVLDPGVDLAKTPAQSIELLRRLDAVAALGRPLLLALSRKDFVGALTGRGPAERDPGTLAAIGAAAGAGPAIARVHDVRGAADFLAVRAALDGDRAPADLTLAEHLRREPVSGAGR
jgi:dihydropteroate synthase